MFRMDSTQILHKSMALLVNVNARIAGGCVEAHLVKTRSKSLVDLSLLQHPPLVHRLFREERREEREETRENPTDRKDKDHLRERENARNGRVVRRLVLGEELTLRGFAERI